MPRKTVEGARQSILKYLIKRCEKKENSEPTPRAHKLQLFISCPATTEAPALGACAPQLEKPLS